jgi:hypothetical protein
MADDRVHVSQCRNMPSGHHWAIITDSSKDDGWGGQTGCVEYTAYLSREAWEYAINELEQQRGYSKSYRAIEVFPATVERKVVVGVDSSKK